MLTHSTRLIEAEIAEKRAAAAVSSTMEDGGSSVVTLRAAHVKCTAEVANAKSDIPTTNRSFAECADEDFPVAMRHPCDVHRRYVYVMCDQPHTHKKVGANASAPAFLCGLCGYAHATWKHKHQHRH